MKQLLIILTISLVATGLYAQAPDTLWSRFYGDRPGWDGYDQLYGATPTYDGGFAMNGYSTTSGDTIKGDQWVVKINSDGDTLWTATYGEFDRRDYGRDITETYDNCLAILGHGRIASTSEDYRVRLFKADSLGNEIWVKNFYGIGSLNTQRIIETNDHGFAIAGYTDDKDVFLIRTDSLGDSLWSQTFGGVDDDIAYDLCQTSDDGFMIVGTTESFGAGSYDIYVIKTLSDGTEDWSATFGTDSYEEGRAIAKTHDGHYMIAGSYVNLNTDVYLIKIQENGDTLWTKSTGQSAANDNPIGITATADHGFLVAGKNYNVINYHNDMYLLKIDANGDSLWSYSYITSTHDEARIAYQAADGNTYLFGTRAPTSSGEYRDYWAIAFDDALAVDDGEDETQPDGYSLSHNYPNPFNPSTTIEYNVVSRSDVTIDIYNIIGQKLSTLVNEIKPAGKYKITWDGLHQNGTQAASGIYFYRFRAGEYEETHKMILIK